jgi:hypothetical protein
VSSGSSDGPHGASATRRLNSVALLPYSYIILLMLCVPTPSPRTAAAAPMEAARPRAEGAARPSARSSAVGARTRPRGLVVGRMAVDGVSPNTIGANKREEIGHGPMMRTERGYETNTNARDGRGRERGRKKETHGRHVRRHRPHHMRLRRAREPRPAHPAGREAGRVRARHVCGEHATNAHAVPEREDYKD